MKIFILFIFLINISHASIKPNIKSDEKYVTPPEIWIALDNLLKTHQKMLDYIDNRIKELMAIKNRNFIEEQELGALILIQEGDPVKIDNYLRMREEYDKQIKNKKDTNLLY